MRGEAGANALWLLAVLEVLAAPAYGQTTQKLAPIEERRAEAQTMLARFREEIKTAQDPVALAIPLATYPWEECAVTAMDVLLEHWDDPRSEAVLEEIGRGEPKYLRDGFLTHAGEAYERLLILRARKEYRTLLADGETPSVKWEKIQQVFAEHPDWVDPPKRPLEKTALVRMLVETAKEVGQGQAVELVARAHVEGARSERTEFFRKHIKETAAFAEQLGAVAALKMPDFPEALRATGDPRIAQLFEKWFLEAKETWVKERLVRHLAVMPGGEKRLTTFIESPEAPVVVEAARWLSRLYASGESLEGARSARQRLQRGGASELELKLLDRYIRDMEEELAKP